jgi:hypothetical protein
MSEFALLIDFGSTYTKLRAIHLDEAKILGSSQVAVQAMAAPIITFVFGGATGHSSDALVAALASGGTGVLASSFLGGLPGSFADKLIATFIGLAILRALPSGLTAGVPLPKTDQSGALKMVLMGLGVGIAILLYVYSQIKPA